MGITATDMYFSEGAPSVEEVIDLVQQTTGLRIERAKVDSVDSDAWPSWQLADCPDVAVFLFGREEKRLVFSTGSTSQPLLLDLVHISLQKLGGVAKGPHEVEKRMERNLWKQLPSGRVEELRKRHKRKMWLAPVIHIFIFGVLITGFALALYWLGCF